MTKSAKGNFGFERAGGVYRLSFILSRPAEQEGARSSRHRPRKETSLCAELFPSFRLYVSWRINGLRASRWHNTCKLTPQAGCTPTMPNVSDCRQAKRRLLRTREAAEYLGMSAWSLRQLVQNGGLPVVRGCDECNLQFDVCDPGRLHHPASADLHSRVKHRT